MNRRTRTAGHLDEIADQFETIECRQFGADGFEDAVKQISEIGAGIGIADIAQFTAPLLPKLYAPEKR